MTDIKGRSNYKSIHGSYETTNNDILEGKRTVISVINYNLYYLEIIYLHVNIHTPVLIFYRMETYNLIN